MALEHDRPEQPCAMHLLMVCLDHDIVGMRHWWGKLIGGFTALRAIIWKPLHTRDSAIGVRTPLFVNYQAFRDCSTKPNIARKKNRPQGCLVPALAFCSALRSKAWTTMIARQSASRHCLLTADSFIGAQ